MVNQCGLRGGVLVTNPWTGYQASPRAVSDGAGGVIVVWLDGRAGFCSPSFLADCDIYGQRLNSSGALLWGSAGAPVATAANNQGVGGMGIVSDGAGGAIVAFQDNRINTTTQSGSGGYTVYAQRMNSNGSPVWPVDGIRIGQDPEAGDAANIAEVKLVPDGSGGAIGAWNFTSNAVPNTISVRTQRISSIGQLMWGTGPLAVPGVSASDPYESGTQTFDMTTDGSGGALIVASWTPQSATAAVVLAQRIGSAGNVAWSQPGWQFQFRTIGTLIPQSSPMARADSSRLGKTAPMRAPTVTLPCSTWIPTARQPGVRVRFLSLGSPINSLRPLFSQTERGASSPCGRTAAITLTQIPATPTQMFMRRI